MNLEAAKRRSPMRLAGARITLRWPQADDAHLLYKSYFSDSECSRYLKREAHTSIEQTRVAIRKLIASTPCTKNKIFALTMECNERRTAMGIITCVPKGTEVEIHYGLARGNWGRGLATEALNLASNALLESGVYSRVFTVCPAVNLPSLRVLEKAGFTVEGYETECLLLPALGDMPRDGILYAKYGPT